MLWSGMEPRSFLFLLASGRRDGNAERLARRAATALATDVGQTWLRLDDLPLPPFEDLRHSAHGYPAPRGDELRLAEATLAATDLVFVTPVYWYALPASAKRYLDAWSAWMRVPALAFAERLRGRRMWAVVVDSSEPHESAFAPLVDCLVRSAAYMQMRWMGALHGHGNRAGDALADEGARTAADRYFGSAAAE
jgi:multimeric flavodoxin WrbA